MALVNKTVQHMDCSVLGPNKSCIGATIVSWSTWFPRKTLYQYHFNFKKEKALANKTVQHIDHCAIVRGLLILHMEVSTIREGIDYRQSTECDKHSVGWWWGSLDRLWCDIPPPKIGLTKPTPKTTPLETMSSLHEIDPMKLACPYDMCMGTAMGTFDVACYSGGRRVRCCGLNLHHSWFFCSVCPSPAQWKSRKAFVRHHNTYHSCTGQSLEVPNKRIATSPIYQEVFHGASGFGREESREFFSSAHHSDGPACLVAKCHFNDPHAPVSGDDVQLVLRIARFVSSNSRPANVEFAKILDLVDKKVRKEMQQKVTSSSDFRVAVPTSMEEIRRSYLYGKGSFAGQLPHPPVYEDVPDHAYCSIRECLADALAHGTPMDFLETLSPPNEVRQFSESAAAAAICRRGRDNGAQVIPVGLEWFDDLDPRRSKQNRGSVWLKTITFLSSTCRNSQQNTYAIGISHKKSNHDMVDAFHAKELAELKERPHFFYSKKHGGVVQVHFELLVSVADQLARRETSGIGAGNGRYTARWGFSADLVSLKDVVPSCFACNDAMLSGRAPSGALCSRCTNWDLLQNHLLLRTNPPPNYPVSETCPDGKIGK